MTDKVTCWDREGGGGRSQGWGGARDTWANSSGMEKASMRNTTAEARAGGEDTQRLWFAAGEERLVTRRGLQDTAGERPAKVEAPGLGTTTQPGRALDRVPGLFPLCRAPQRRLADTPRSTSCFSCSGPVPGETRGSSAESRRETRARRGEGCLLPRGGLHLRLDSQHILAYSFL